MIFIDVRNKLSKKNNDPDIMMKIEDIEETISNMAAKEERDYILKNFKQMSQNPGAVNIKEVWKV